MGCRLIGDHIRYQAVLLQTGQDLGRITNQSDGFWCLLAECLIHPGQGFFQILRGGICCWR